MTLPNRITLVRILLIPLFLYFMLATSLPGSGILAAILFIVIAGSDALDGYLARKLDQVSSFGKLIDPLADKILVLGAFLVFVELHKLSSIVVLLIVARDLAVMGLRVWAAKKGEIIAASSLGKWKTASQMIAIPLLILDWPLQYLMFWTSFVLCLVSGWEYFKGITFEEI